MATNRPFLSGATGEDLMEGVYGALGLLAQTYHAAGGGDVFSYALMRGLNQECTLVAHSDEGLNLARSLGC